MRYLKKAKWLLLFVISAGLVWFMAAKRGEFHFLLDIKYIYLIQLLFLDIIYLFIIGVRYYLAIKAVADKIGFWTCCKYFVVGRFLNKITPQGGVLYRALSFKKRGDIDYHKYFSAFFAFTWIDLTFSFLLGAIILAIYGSKLDINGVNALNVFVILLILFALIIPVSGMIVKSLRRYKTSRRHGRILSFISDVLDGTTFIIKNKMLFLRSCVLIMLNVIISVAIVYLCFKSININADLAVLTLFMMLAKFANVFVVIPGNFGVREFLYGFLSGAMGIGLAEGITASLILRVSNFLVQGFISFIFILGDKFEKERAST